jgi:flagellar L-ring protein precursor FlgH
MSCRITFPRHAAAAVALVLAGCGGLSEVGKVPEFTPLDGTAEERAMLAFPGEQVSRTVPAGSASLWGGSQQFLLGDARARVPGDIMTVVIEIDESAEISNSSSRSRSGSESLQLPSLLGIPQRLERILPGDADFDDAVSADSSSSSSGDGEVRRNERLTLRIAAAVVEVLGNGVLRIQGSQEVRVNFEIRELLVSGFVRPEDISRNNEITYDKIASARISYGGRGQISDVQQPRYGQQVIDRVLPF